MALSGEQVALYGRFRYKPRAEIAEAARAAGAEVGKDLTRSTTRFVVGAGAANFISNGHLPARLERARERGVEVEGEARFLDALAGAAEPDPTFPLDKIGDHPGALVMLLAAFDLVRVKDGKCAFADVSRIRAAIALRAEGHDDAAIIATLAEHRHAPAGRHNLTLSSEGDPLLRWEDGLTTLDGQGVFELEGQTSLEERFEAAMAAEAEGDLDLAERLYGACAQADRRDPIAAFNLGNVLVQKGRPKDAILAYAKAIARDPEFAEAHYNLARLVEAQGDKAGAVRHLRQALEVDPAYPDALFNLGQLCLALGEAGEADRLFQRYLSTDPSPYWRQKARAALALSRQRV